MFFVVQGDRLIPQGRKKAIVRDIIQSSDNASLYHVNYLTKKKNDTLFSCYFEAIKSSLRDFPR